MAVPSEWLVTPGQVWAHVPGELKRRSIELMAHLAMNPWSFPRMIADDPDEKEEAGDAAAHPSIQDPA